MTGTRRRHKGSKTQPAGEKGSTSQDAAHLHGDDCRCKEVSRKTPRELLKVVLGDLAFWKKK